MHTQQRHESWIRINEHLFFSSAVVHKTDFRLEKSASALKNNKK